MGFAPTEEDLKLMDDLRAKFEPTMGSSATQAAIIRMGLRVLAAKEGVQQ